MTFDALTVRHLCWFQIVEEELRNERRLVQRTEPSRAQVPLPALAIAPHRSHALEALHEQSRRSEERLMTTWLLHDQTRAAEEAVAQGQHEAEEYVMRSVTAHLRE